MKITIAQLRRLIQEAVEDVKATSAAQKYETDTAYIGTTAEKLKKLYLAQGNKYDINDPTAYANLSKFVKAQNPDDPNNMFVIEKMAQDFERAANDARIAAKKHGYRSRVIPNL